MRSFLELPREIRDCVYQLLLVKNTGTSQALDLTDVLSVYYTPHPNCPQEPFLGSIQPTKWLFSSPRLLNIGSTAILRTCRRAAQEGAQVLYGSSTIKCIPGGAFHSGFLPKIGLFNSSCIRSVHLWLNTFFTTEMINLANTRFKRRLHDTTKFLVNLLNRKLSQLQDLVLGIPAANCHHLNLNTGLPSSKIWWIRAHCAMLWFSAWITTRHPRLKQAVWSQRWINRYTPENVEDLQYLDISVRITAPSTKWGSRKGPDFEELAWYVRQGLLNTGIPIQSIEVSGLSRCPGLGKNQILTVPQGIPLNSQAIRWQGLDGLRMDHNPLSYGVGEVTKILEVGQARNVMEDISNRFGYKESGLDNAPGGGWGDLEGLHAHRRARRTQNTAGILHDTIK